MRTLIVIILLCLLITTCWPLALVALFLFPLIWLLLLPFQIIGLTIGLVFKLIGAILLFPFKVIASI